MDNAGRGHTDNRSTYISLNDYGVSHSFKVAPSCFVKDGNGNTNYLVGTYCNSTSYFTTPKSPTSIHLSNTTSTSIDVNVDGLEGNYYGVEFRYRIYGSNGTWDTLNINGTSGTISN